MAAFLITSMMPVIFVAVYSNMKYEAATHAKINSYSTQILDEVTRNASDELQQYETLSENMIMNDSIQEGLQQFSKMSDYEKSKLYKRILNELSVQIFGISNISNIMILNNDGQTLFDLGYEMYPRNGLFNMLSSTNNSPGNAYWSYIRSNRGTHTITLSRIIYSKDNLNLKLGYVIIFVDEKVFSQNVYKHVNLGTGSEVFISDSKGMVISTVSPKIPHGKSYAQKEVFDPIKQQFQKDTKLHAFNTDVDHQGYLVTSSYIRSADWFLIGMIPKAFILAELTDMRRNIVALCVFTLLGSGGISMWIYFSISSPMRSLLQYAKRIRMGQLDTTIGTPYADEMGKLTETIDNMVERLKDLIYQVEAEQQAKREAELKMLQAQINPHFLFNTLNSLKWSAMLGGNQAVMEGLDSLSVLLQNTIMVKEEMIPLSQEIDNLNHYATIQRIRYGDSFSLHCDIPQELANYPVLKFLLQPIVENSIIHGTGEDGRRVDIQVTARLIEHKVRIVISDNGKGFDVEELQTQASSRSKLSGIGTQNVHERIVLHFGKAFGLDVCSIPGEGTKAEIILPFEVEGGNPLV
ncbi:sensor histidine kinase [Paenibacillus puldeungensis]